MVGENLKTSVNGLSTNGRVHPSPPTGSLGYNTTPSATDSAPHRILSSCNETHQCFIVLPSVLLRGSVAVVVVGGLGA